MVSNPGERKVCKAKKGQWGVSSVVPEKGCARDRVISPKLVKDEELAILEDFQQEYTRGDLQGEAGIARRKVVGDINKEKCFVSFR